MQYYEIERTVSVSSKSKGRFIVTYDPYSTQLKICIFVFLYLT